MFKQIARIGLLLIVLNQLLQCEALRNHANRGYSSKYGSKNKETAQPKVLASSSLPGQNTARRGLGLSAWGIVTVIVSLIMAIVGMYYFSICYPILCKKTRKYDMIGLPNEKKKRQKKTKVKEESRK